MRTVCKAVRGASAQRRTVGTRAACGWLLVALLVVSSVYAASAAGPVTIYYFWGEGCPYCARESAFLQQLLLRYPQVRLEAYEVWYNAANRARMFAMLAERNVASQGSVPVTIIGDEVWIGFNEAVAIAIELAVRNALGANDPAGAFGADPARTAPGVAATPAGEVLDADPALSARNGTSVAQDGQPSEASDESTSGCTLPEQACAVTPAGPSELLLDVPLLGNVDLAGRGLVLSTVLLGFVDGMNPCSLWVLSILLALVLHSRSRRKVIVVGVTFLAVAAAVYGAFMAGLFGVLQLVGYTPWLRAAIAAVTLVMALLNLKDFVAFRRGASLTISDKAKPGLYARMRRILASDRYGQTVVLTAALAAGVSLLELPCTAGFPVMWTNLVASSGVTGPVYALLLALYLLLFVIDELAVFLVVAATMRVRRLTQDDGRLLKLVAGVLMLYLSAVLLVRPSLMEEMSGALWVFAASLVTVVLAWLLDRRRRKA